MKAKKDNGIEEDKDDLNEESEQEGSAAKKMKIKRYVQMGLGGLGLAVMIYVVFFQQNPEQQQTEALQPQDLQSAPTIDDQLQPKPKFEKEEIVLERRNKGEVVAKDKDIREFAAPADVKPASPPQISAPEIPPLPEFQFSKPEDNLPPKPTLDDISKSENIKTPKNDEKKSDEKTENANDPNALNPDEVIAAKKKNMTIFSFSNPSGGGYQQQKSNTAGASKGSEKDFIIYDKSRLHEVLKEDPATNATVTQIGNLDNKILQGKMIDVILETAINSQLPGAARGIVSRDVFAETGKKILIPKGTRVYGTYQSTVSRGQSRLNITWNRVIRPDGAAIQMTAQASDQFGRIGIEADVDNRFSEIISNSLLLTFVNLGTAVAFEKLTGATGQTQVVNNNGSVATTNINPANIAAQNVIQSTSDVLRRLTEGSLNLQPIVTLPQGTRIKVIVNQDITLPDYKKLSLN